MDDQKCEGIVLMASVRLTNSDRYDILRNVSKKLRDKTDSIGNLLNNHKFIENIATNISNALKQIEVDSISAVKAIGISSNPSFDPTTTAYVGFMLSTDTSCLFNSSLEIPSGLAGFVNHRKIYVDKCTVVDSETTNSFINLLQDFKDTLASNRATEKELKGLLDNTPSTGKLEEVWPTVVQYYPSDLKRKIEEANVPKPKKEKVKRKEVKPSESLEHSLILLNLGI